MKLLGEFFAVLLLVGFIGTYFWQIAAVLALAGVAWLAGRLLRLADDLDDEDVQRRDDLISRADVQHQQVLSGDDRGVYGAGFSTYQRWQRGKFAP